MTIPRLVVPIVLALASPFLLSVISTSDAADDPNAGVGLVPSLPAPLVPLEQPEPTLPAPEEQSRYAVNTHRAITNRALRHPGSVVDAFLKQELRLTAGINTPTPNGPVSVRLEDGAEHEDDSPIFGLVRPRNHFYDPTTNGGLSDIANGLSSLVWAYEHPDNEFDWQSTREAYFEALTASSPNTRAQRLGDTFYALGHVVHLLEDLGQPQHTRNDAHITGFPGSPYETYCSTNYGTPGAVATLGNGAIPSFGVLPGAVGNAPPEFVAFWDTGQYTGQRVFRGFSATPGLAEYSHAFFITDDTMFGASNLVFLRRATPPGLTVELEWTVGNSSTSAIHDHPNPALRQTNLASFYPATTTRISLEREGDYPGDDPLFYVDLEVRDAGGAIVHTTPDLFMVNDNDEMGFDDVCYQSHAELLIPQAVGYAAGLMNYFFRGRVSIPSPTLSWNSGENVNELEITNESGEEFGDGTWTLYVDDMNGARTPVDDFDTSAYSGLASGGSFTAKFPELLCEGGVQYTLVFRGQIGNETGAIAAKSFVGPPEVWTGTYSIPATELCLETNGVVTMTVDRPTVPGYEITALIDFGPPGSVYAPGTCAGGQLQIAFNPDCGYILSGTIAGHEITDAQTCCWYCPLDPPPEGPFFCGTVSNLRRTK